MLASSALPAASPTPASFSSGGWQPGVSAGRGCPRSGDSRVQTLFHLGFLALLNSPPPDRRPEGRQRVRCAPLAGALSLQGARQGEVLPSPPKKRCPDVAKPLGVCAALSDDFFAGPLSV